MYIKNAQTGSFDEKTTKQTALYEKKTTPATTFLRKRFKSSSRQAEENRGRFRNPSA